MMFKIGDKVILNGYIYTSSNSTTPANKITNKVTNITCIFLVAHIERIRLIIAGLLIKRRT